MASRNLITALGLVQVTNLQPASFLNGKTDDFVCIGLVESSQESFVSVVEKKALLTDMSVELPQCALDTQHDLLYSDMFHYCCHWDSSLTNFIYLSSLFNRGGSQAQTQRTRVACINAS